MIFQLEDTRAGAAIILAVSSHMGTGCIEENKHWTRALPPSLLVQQCVQHGPHLKGRKLLEARCGKEGSKGGTERRRVAQWEGKALLPLYLCGN